MVTLTTRANMPVPPLNRGSSKQEKRDFMDSYMVYKRRVDALNQGTQTQVFVMPIGACIEQSTLVRICRFELFKPEATVTEEDWKRYFLDARNADFTAYKQLDVAVRGLTVDVQLQDAKSCMSRLLANFYSTGDGMNMESIIHDRSEALECPVGKPLKKDVSKFVRWLRPQIEEFMKYETHILAAQQGVSNAVSQQPRKRKPSRRHGGKPDQQPTDGRHQSPGASV
ncbi:hypothetical protein PPTG_12995 [Phytophthora nicotianae INRA-310]|uniref:Uncharacterized protein n=1 Tax=Phytophthora nicotianae (strain INRA-310) TaxID=761204 RepID=W2Q368_PHYN3|nr:hypothetical protein PPTG_12995 [Phytophthora nicotianae INRA-310]ETN07653.1 hypothetical protein PPTG_12995 [Phytophthora nicotianae INRA-310]